MSVYFTAKRGLKLIRWRARRVNAASKWGRARLAAAPIVFGNAMPKSGSHLLTQILGGLTVLGPFVDPGFPPVNRSEANKPLSNQAIQAGLQAMCPGDIRYGYLNAREPYISQITSPDWATFFIYRDPRDLLVSHVFYATNMYDGHGMHRYYTEILTSMEERLNAAIEGVADPALASIRQRYDVYMTWFDRPDI